MGGWHVLGLENMRDMLPQKSNQACVYAKGKHFAAPDERGASLTVHLTVMAYIGSGNCPCSSEHRREREALSRASMNFRLKAAAKTRRNALIPCGSGGCRHRLFAL